MRRAFPLDVTPTYDDRPYFFFHSRLKDVLFGGAAASAGDSSINLPAVRILVTLSITVLVLGALLIFLASCTAAPRAVGDWHGTIVTPQGELTVVVHIAEKAGGFTGELDSQVDGTLRRRVLGCVVDEVGQHLLQALGVAPHPGVGIGRRDDDGPAGLEVLGGGRARGK